MSTNKEIFEAKMNALANSINTKAGSSGAKDIDALKTAVDGIVTPSGNQPISTLAEYDVSAKATARVSDMERSKILPANIVKGITILGVTGTFEGGSRPYYLLNDGDSVSELYFNTDYDLGTEIGYEASAMTWVTDPVSGLNVCELGIGYLYVVDLTSGEYALVWNDGVNIVPIYASTAVPDYGVTVAGWQMTSYTPSSSFTFYEDDVDAGFIDIMDMVFAQEQISFGTTGGGETEYYLTFSSESPFTLATRNATKNWNGKLYYSTDKGTWAEWDGATAISSGNDNKIYLRGAGNTKITNNSSSKGFLFTGTDIECNGNIETLLDYASVENGFHPDMAQQSSYQGLFKGCINLVKAPSLPAPQLTPGCYSEMFSGCTSLVKAPALPAVILDQNSVYSKMFYGCTALVEPPSMSHITKISGVGAVNAMFEGCTSLAKLPKFTATDWGSDNNAGWRMFYGCSLIKVSATQTGEYVNEYRAPASGTATYGTATPLGNALVNTGGTHTGNIEMNTTYYTSNAIVE